jgi:twitching motility two-component system response regulator PilH
MSKDIVIVLADDEPFIQLAYKEGLERAGYTIFGCDNGADALAKVKDVKPDLVMLDLMMPRMNGFEVLKKIKSDPKLKNTHVVILSNLSQPQDEKEAAEEGAIDFLVKSDYSMEQVIEKVSGWVESIKGHPTEK